MNLINQINIEYITPSRTIETLKLTSENKNIVTYIYNFEGNCFRFFSSKKLLNSFFQSKIESKHLFHSDLEIDDFLFNYKIRKSNENFEYSIQDEIILISGGKEILTIAISAFKEKAKFLLEKIKENKSRTFSVPEIEAFMQSINCISLKANSATKTDITLVVHDQRTNQHPTLGFSIKSQLGSPSTLLNAGKTTNFIFKISNLQLSESEIERINSIDTRSKIMDRINSVLQAQGDFEFIRTERRMFSNNLVLIDSKLPEILSQIVYEFYSSDKSSVIDLVEEITSKNPIGFDVSNNHQFYEYKMKKFLTDIALGMMPSKVWSGQFDATGGYLIVKENGDVLCYHIYHRNEFEDYLINNTKLDTASSSRHDFGKIYSENGELYFKLNLQIRFIK